MLSTDLRMLSRQLSEWKDDCGALHLPAKTAAGVERVLDECASIARNLEASRLDCTPIVIDLSDPTIALFPVVKRPIPVDDTNVPPVAAVQLDDDGAA